MTNAIIETLVEEGSNLSLHVQLCEQRYLQLLGKFDQVDTKLEKINETLLIIQSKLETEQSTKLRTYLSWAGFLIVTLLGTVAHLLTR
jgi:hypothetical protein